MEIVQRPSKSWKRISYEDHDFSRDSSRTVCITTYQLHDIERTTDCELSSAAYIGNARISSSRIRGQGVSIVKMTAFQPESAFRHMNELLFLMSRSEHRDHFTRNDDMVPSLLITCDNGK